MRKLYEFKTSGGTVHIAEQKGRFYGLLDGQKITGGYKSDDKLARDLTAGQFAVDGLDPSLVAVPAELNRWRALDA